MTDTRWIDAWRSLRPDERGYTRYSRDGFSASPVKAVAFGFPRDRTARVLLLQPVGRDDVSGSSPVSTAGEPPVRINAYRRAMPEVSRFYGIIITINFADHQPPHFHARHGEHRAWIVRWDRSRRSITTARPLLGSHVGWSSPRRARGGLGTRSGSPATGPDPAA